MTTFTKGAALGRLLLTVLVALAGAGCASTGSSAKGSDDIYLDRHSDGNIVRLHRGQRLIVTLPGNPSTGYQWEELPGASGVLARQGDADYTSDGRELGVGGYYRFTFLAVATGKAPLRLVYRRPFEQGVKPMATFSVDIDVFH